MTNAEILKMFLKKHRKYSAYKRYVNMTKTTEFFHNHGIINKPKFPQHAIEYAFQWNSSYVKEPTDDWHKLHNDWVKLCKEFKLTDKIDFKDI